MSKKPSHFNQGFSLIEMAIVLLIIGLALGMILNVTRGMRDTQNRQLVQSKLTTLDTALANFVAQNKRLPCPANGTIASGAVNAGMGDQVIGAQRSRHLGLRHEVRLQRIIRQPMPAAEQQAHRQNFIGH